MWIQVRRGHLIFCEVDPNLGTGQVLELDINRKYTYASVDKSNVNFDNVHEDGHKNEE